MKLIAGLGNPGREYEQSRHNVGFDVVDLLSERWQVPLSRNKFHGHYGQGHYGGESVALLKPQTFMNRSGLSVGSLIQFYQIAASDILVIVDDMALPVGRLRIRGKGSAGGHNGLKDIIAALGTDDFCRLRIGIGTGRGDNAVSHVLGRFERDERLVLHEVYGEAMSAVESWLVDGVVEAMNRYNRKE